MKNNVAKREMFSSSFAVFFATLGSAVGLGNIWKFPYLTGSNGGAAFIFVYLGCVLLVGIPVMICEFYIGRRTRKDAVSSFEKLGKSKFKIIGYMGIISSLLIMFFYTSVAGWVYSYVFKALKGDFSSLTGKGVADAKNITGAAFGNFISGYEPMIWQVIVLLVVSAILIAGVKNGIEKITKTLMPVLFILIIICDIRGLTLSGAPKGLDFLFNPDFSKINAGVILSALGLAFFKLSIGMGTMITYGSYFTKNNNMIATSVKVAVSDILISLLAGIAIFPAVFTYGMEPTKGAGLLFESIPLVFAKMPFGNILLVAFFFLTAIAATTAMISLLEVPVAYLIEKKGLSRTRAVILSSSLIGIVGLLTVNTKSIFGSVMIFGKSFFDLYDYVSSNILLPLGGLLIAILVAYIIKREDVKNELSNNNTLNNKAYLGIYFSVLKYVSPVLLVIIFLNSIGIIKF